MVEAGVRATSGVEAGVSRAPLIEIGGLTKRYGALVAVDNVSM